MRITTGKFKGRNIGMPGGIRPTQAKARKAVFDILGDIEGLAFLELFAGSGAVGLEAASRGAREVIFVENEPGVLKTLASNTSVLSSRYLIIPLDVQKALARLSKEGKRFDIIFLDPPYFKLNVSESGVDEESLAKKTLKTLEACDILAPNGLIIVQHFDKENLPVELGVLSLFRNYTYGSTILSLYRKENR
ncbi:MAG: 16S rRNA (guanine(966)-N(2))-methyltransferase RsmD [Candidatus Omnitrophota bacterium]|jgi:16S rRNA (guanine(966)-N(2))-methyltransferase RsmD